MPRKRGTPEEDPDYDPDEDKRSKQTIRQQKHRSQLQRHQQQEIPLTILQHTPPLSSSHLPLQTTPQQQFSRQPTFPHLPLLPVHSEQQQQQQQQQQQLPLGFSPLAFRTFPLPAVHSEQQQQQLPLNPLQRAFNQIQFPAEPPFHLLSQHAPLSLPPSPTQQPTERQPSPPPRQSRGQRKQGTGRYALDSTTPLPHIQPYQLQPRNVTCSACGALMWREEHSKLSKSANLATLTFALCCRNGKVRLPAITPPPAFFERLFSNRHVMDHILTYNGQFQMASTGTIKRYLPKSGPCQYKISGTVHHRIGALTVPPHKDAVFAQRFTYEPKQHDAQTWSKGAKPGSLRPDLLRDIMVELQRCNPYALEFKRAANNKAQDMLLVFRVPPSGTGPDAWLQRHRYNLPNQSNTSRAEVATLITNFEHRLDILVCKQRGERGERTLLRVPDINASVDPMVFPLLFPMGDSGFEPRIPLDLDIPKAQADPFAAAAAAERLIQREPDDDDEDTGPSAAVMDVAEPQRWPDQEEQEDADEEPADASCGEALGRRTANKEMRTAITQAAVRDAMHDLGLTADDGDQEEEMEGEERPSHQRHVSIREFYAYQLQDRLNQRGNCHLLRGGALLEQYMVFAYCKEERTRLQFERDRQIQLRTEQYQGLRDVLHASDIRQDHSGRRAGRPVMLPSSFMGGPRYYQQNYMDGMAKARVRGKPHLFLTMSCNPEWPDLKAQLRPGMNANARADLIARVFKLHLDELMRDLTINHVLGRVTAHMHVVEFQKRGLPHAHILLWLEDSCAPTNTPAIDTLVWAEIPDKALHPELHAAVVAFMLHGPCIVHGCWDALHHCCVRHFPKNFQPITSMAENGYPLYQRRDLPQRTVEKNGSSFDNQWVVPYNPYLLLKHQCHLNVEVCTGIRSIKYLYDYILKGGTRVQAAIITEQQAHAQTNETRPTSLRQNPITDATKAAASTTSACNTGTAVQITEEDRDEIRDFQDMRYIGSSEAAWRLLGFPLVHQHPPTLALDIHLEGHQNITYQADQDLFQIEAQAKERVTKLMAWFKLNSEDARARQYLYQDIPSHYVWVKATAQASAHWKPRQRGDCIGRMYCAHPGEEERFYLRTLLAHVPGATSFSDLRTVDGHVCATFREACVRLGLLQDDAEWDRCLEEMTVFRKAHSLRKLFVLILTHGNPKEPIKLWQKHQAALCEDFSLQNQDPDQDRPSPASQRATLQQIASLLEGAVPPRHLTDFSIPLPDAPTPPISTSPAAPPTPAPVAHLNLTQQHELLYDAEDLDAHIARDEARLTDEQRRVYRKLQAAVTEYRAWKEPPLSSRPAPTPHAFFLHSVAGGGKTFILDLLLAWVRREEHSAALATAASGIAAQLLQGGMTAHSTFRLSTRPMPNLSSGLGKLTDMAKHLQSAVELIVVDEATMLHMHLIQQLDATLRDVLTQPDVPFAGMPIVFSGDFGQTLPVIRHASSQQQAAAAMCYAPTWRYLLHAQMTQNMRIQRAAAAGRDTRSLQEFSEHLLAVRNGSIGSPLKIPAAMLLPLGQRTLEHLIEFVWGDLNQPLQQSTLTNRALLTPLNQHVDEITDALTTRIPGVGTTYTSADSLVGDINSALFGVDVLNTLHPSGVPAHSIVLKPGMPFMVTRNLNGIMGLVNGTRLLIRDCFPRCLRATILTGRRKDEEIYIPRVSIDTDDDSLPVQFRRLQLPGRACLAMTLNKAQGQSLQRIGIYLPVPVFAHGQLYVGESRVDDAHDARILITHTQPKDVPRDARPGEYTLNVVERGVLDDVATAIRTRPANC